MKSRPCFNFITNQLLLLIVLGPLFETRFKLWSFNLDTSPSLRKSLKEMENLARTQPINEWERKLVGVIKDFAIGYVQCLKN